MTDGEIIGEWRRRRLECKKEDVKIPLKESRSCNR
jgi:hypothetical protein